MFNVLKSFTAALIQNLFVAIILAIVTVPVMVSIFTGSIDLLIGWLNSEAPVWLVLVCFLVSLVYVRFSRKVKVPSQQPESKKFLIEDSGFKWRVIDHGNGFTSVDQIPLCPTHESELVLTPGNQYMCRETLGSKCESKILDPKDLTFYWNLAKSKAGSIVHKYETKH